MGGKTRTIKGTGSAFGHTGGYKPFVSNKEGAGHTGQPSGKSIGYGSKRSYAHNAAAGTGSQPSGGYTAGGAKGGHGQAKMSELASNSNVDPKGGSFRGRLGQADSFKNVGDAAGKAHGFCHEGGLRQGSLRMSGDPRAHRVGSRKK